jgi:hypothetical protein
MTIMITMITTVTMIPTTITIGRRVMITSDMEHV